MSKIALSGDASGTGTFTIASPNSNSNYTATLPANTGTIVTNNSTPAFASTIGVGGATAATSGAGVTFPATQSASSDANTLDDYEEGTWTVTLTGTGGSAGAYAASSNGSYTKIGRLVHVMGSVTLSNKGSWSGTVYIALPFTPVGRFGTGAVRSQWHTFDGTLVFEWSTVGANARFNVTKTGTAQTNLQWSDLSAATDNYLEFSLTYFV